MAGSESVIVPVRMGLEELAAVDRVRGSTPRSTWIKALCAAAVLARDAFDGEACEIRLRAVRRKSHEPR